MNAPARMRSFRFGLVLLALSTAAAIAQKPGPGTEPVAAAPFPNGLPRDPTFFPLAVWLQSPHQAKRYRELGINLYVGLWEGPTKGQLDALDAAGMQVICAQNEVGLAHQGTTIVGWLQADEPDNAQARQPSGWGPPILPSVITAEYQRLRRRDPTRPVLLNLGQGVAFDGWYGRGERTNHPEDYAEYCKGCDIASFDIYPVTHTHADVRDKLEFVGRGVTRLLAATGGRKPVWAAIETTHIDNPKARPTAAQVRSEVWIAICSGASGIIYFAHEFAPQFVEAGLLAHEEIAAAVQAVNTDVLAQATVLNTPIVAPAVEVTSRPKGEFAVRAHRVGATLHVFVASLRADATKARFRVRAQRTGTVRVDGGAARALADGAFTDEVESYGVRHYRIEP